MARISDPTRAEGKTHRSWICRFLTFPFHDALFHVGVTAANRFMRKKVTWRFTVTWVAMEGGWGNSSLQEKPKLLEVKPKLLEVDGVALVWALVCPVHSYVVVLF